MQTPDRRKFQAEREKSKSRGFDVKVLVHSRNIREYRMAGVSGRGRKKRV